MKNSSSRITLVLIVPDIRMACVTIKFKFMILLYESVFFGGKRNANKVIANALTLLMTLNCGNKLSISTHVNAETIPWRVINAIDFNYTLTLSKDRP